MARWQNIGIHKLPQCPVTTWLRICYCALLGLLTECGQLSRADVQYRLSLMETGVCCQTGLLSNSSIDPYYTRVFLFSLSVSLSHSLSVFLSVCPYLFPLSGALICNVHHKCFPPSSMFLSICLRFGWPIADIVRFTNSFTYLHCIFGRLHILYSITQRKTREP